MVKALLASLLLLEISARIRYLSGLPRKTVKTVFGLLGLEVFEEAFSEFLGRS